MPADTVFKAGMELKDSGRRAIPSRALPVEVQRQVDCAEPWT